MYRIAILGCENSHAFAFLDRFTGENPEGIEISGVYSDEQEPVQKIHEKYGVPVMENYDQLAGQVDGVVITARHGDNHYKYARPYIPYGIPMFIDKPITCSEAEAVEFMRDLKAHGIRVSGGSICPHAPEAQQLAQLVKEGGAVGGSIFCPISMDSPYGGFHFYCQHLVETMLAVFGYDIQAVNASRREGSLSLIARYPGFDVTGTFVDGGFGQFYVTVAQRKQMHSAGLTISSNCSADEMVNLLRGCPMPKDYDTFIRPVFVHNAILRSVEKNGWEEIRTVQV